MEVTIEEQRASVKIMTLHHKKPSEIHQELVEACGEWMWEGFPLQLLQSVESLSGTMWGSVVMKNERIHQVRTFPSHRVY